jgi:hypothetical protein
MIVFELALRAEPLMSEIQPWNASRERRLDGGEDD